MNLFWLFDTCGYIVGPLIMITGLIALGLCLRASRASATQEYRRRALIAALLPAAVGFVGAVFGLVVWLAAGAQGEPWAALGKVCLAGMVVAAVPLLWSALLHRGGGGVRPAPDH